MGIHKSGASGPKAAPSLSCKGYHCREVNHIDINPVPRDDGSIGLYSRYHWVRDCSAVLAEALRPELATVAGKPHPGSQYIYISCRYPLFQPATKRAEAIKTRFYKVNDTSIPPDQEPGKILRLYTLMF